MKKLFLSAALALLIVPGTAHAGSKFMGMWWWPSHWFNQDFKPYYQDGQLPQQSQWSTENWQAGDWVSQSGGDGLAMVERLYRTAIIKDQYVDDKVPVLEVGPNFYHLSGFDKRRAMATVDHVYQVTSRKPGMFYLKDGITEKMIGYYTADAGLILE